MIRLLAFLLGLVAGAAGAAVLYARWIDHSERSLAALEAFPKDGVEWFFLDVPGHEVALTHGGIVPMAPFPPGIASLGEPNVRLGLGLVTKLRDVTGDVVGFASELEAASPETSLAQGRIMTDTFWTVVVPGRGALFLHQTEDNWDLVTRIALPAILLRRDWTGDWTNVNTVGPRPDGRGAVVGGSGEFAGARGSFIEVGRLRRFGAAGAMEFTMELRVALERGD
jgi:hypothetical protein